MVHGYVQLHPVCPGNIVDSDCLEIHATIVQLLNLGLFELAVSQKHVCHISIMNTLCRGHLGVVKFEEVSMPTASCANSIETQLEYRAKDYRMHNTTSDID